jgi:tripartite-type tricarboxylate transporter receptor subunit TctC
VLGGHADALYEQPGDVMAFLEAKQMKPILTFLQGPRVSAFPDAPTMSEVGPMAASESARTSWFRWG